MGPGLRRWCLRGWWQSSYPDAHVFAYAHTHVSNAERHADPNGD
jgi:hypothetical protein